MGVQLLAGHKVGNPVFGARSYSRTGEPVTDAFDYPLTFADVEEHKEHVRTFTPWYAKVAVASDFDDHPNIFSKDEPWSSTLTLSHSEEEEASIIKEGSVLSSRAGIVLDADIDSEGSDNSADETARLRAERDAARQETDQMHARLLELETKSEELETKITDHDALVDLIQRKDDGVSSTFKGASDDPPQPLRCSLTRDH